MSLKAKVAHESKTWVEANQPETDGSPEETVGLRGTKPSLREKIDGLKARVTMEKDSDSFHRDQMNMTWVAKLDGKPAAKLDWTLFQETPSVSYLKTYPGFERQGLGAMMLLALQEEFPDTEIKLGYSTDEGAALLAALEVEKRPTEWVEKFDSIAPLKAEVEVLQGYADRVLAGDGIKTMTPEARAEFDRKMERLNEVNDTLWVLDQELWDKSPVKRILRLPGATEAAGEAEAAGTPGASKRLLYSLDHFTLVNPNIDLREARQLRAAHEAKWNAHFLGTDLEGEWIYEDVGKIDSDEGWRFTELDELISNLVVDPNWMKQFETKSGEGK